MFNPLARIFSRDDKNRPSIPDGERIYCIGDIHGRLDLFDALANEIDSDDSAANAAKSTVILLGDLIDRGPESAQVIARAREWQKARALIGLVGNHEEMFLRSFEDEKVLRQFIKYGGRETLLSYGISFAEFNAASIAELAALMAARVPAEDIAFLNSFDDKIAVGGYLFVHAGIDPARDIDAQKPADMRWIREPFLSFSGKLPYMVVHGHTIFDAVDERKNRIGIDTGAYKTGCLTALVLEGQSRRYIQAIENESGEILVAHKGQKP